jgi:hypothetical protein
MRCYNAFIKRKTVLWSVMGMKRADRHRSITEL